MADTSMTFNIIARDVGATSTANRVANAIESIDDKTVKTNDSIGKANKMFQFFGTHATTIGAVGAALGLLPAAAVAAGGAITFGLGAAIAGLGGLAVGTTDKMKDKFKEFGNFVKEEFREIAAPMKPVLTEMLDVAKDVFKEFGPVLTEFFKEMKGPLITFIRRLGEGFKQLKPIIPPLSAAFKELLNSLGREFPEIFRNIAGGLISLFNTMGEHSDTFSNFIISVSKIVEWLFRFIGVLIRNKEAVAIIVIVLGALAAAFLGPMGAVAGLMAIIGALVGLVMTAWPKVRKFTVEAWHAIWKFFTDLWADIKRLFWQSIDNVIAFFTSLPHRAFAALRSLRGLLHRAGSNALNALGDAISWGVNQVIDWFKSLPRRAMQALSSLRNSLYSAGQDIINGLVSGIQSIAGAVWNKLKSIVSGAWDNVKSFFGIGSPSKEMMWIGEMIGEGLARGIEGQAGKVSSAMKQLSMAGMPDTVIGPNVTSGQVGASTVPAPVDARPTQVSVQVDGREIATAVDEGRLLNRKR